MFLDKRSLDIVKTLIKNPQIKSKELEETMNLTRRQINYSIKKINESLDTLELPKIDRSRNGHFIVNKQIIDYLTKSEPSVSSKGTYYIPTENERVLYLVLYLVAKTEDVSLAHIAEVLEVSKNTVINDLKSANDLLEKYNVAISYSRITGYDLVGTEVNIRKLTRVIISKLLKIYQGDKVISRITNIKIDSAHDKIKSIEKQLNLHYTDQSFEIMAYVILLNERRVEQGHLIEADFHNGFLEMSGTKEYRITCEMLEEYGYWPKQEKEWLVLQFLTASLQYTEVESMEDDTLVTAINEMVKLFEEKSYIIIEDKRSFVNRLLLHLRPAYYRLKYHLTFDSDTYHNFIKGNENYLLLFDLVKETVYPIEKLIHEKIPKNELSLISFFFGAELMRQGINLDNKIYAVVVCTNGISISKLLRLTLSKLFPDFIFLPALSIREFKAYKKKYDIVFTTVPLHSEKPVFLVNALLTESEKNSLSIQVLNELGLNSNGLSAEEVLKIVNQYASVTNESGLKKALKELIEKPSLPKGKVKSKEEGLPGLEDYLSEQTIQLVDEVKDWKEAIRLACQPLVEKNIVTLEYVEAMIEQNDTEETYSFLGCSMAIPHASSEKGVNSDAFAMLVLKQPVTFRNNKKISIITPLAIHNQTRHLKAVNQLAGLAKDKGKIMQLQMLNNPAEVFQYILNKSEELVK
ncbi:BglG family transcription antiterminator [Desemzia incerta]|uniref:BglG family transcription antiterminator n=1 Tax=Desemzia incerta TaxID=82801 RepID=UPI0024C26ADF|nr:BglG family transcription antiterminator [Desemzia incerta]WHZ32873.1 BglG family transcription antiterminator [Desemzia incerta]